MNKINLEVDYENIELTLPLMYQITIQTQSRGGALIPRTTVNGHSRDEYAPLVFSIYHMPIEQS